MLPLDGRLRSGKLCDDSSAIAPRVAGWAAAGRRAVLQRRSRIDDAQPQYHRGRAGAKAPSRHRRHRAHGEVWLTEAPLRMLMNNLDPEVAENPAELVVYGGIGRAARNWECFDAIVAALRRARRRRIAADPVGQAGRRVPHACRCAARADRQFEPRAALGDVGALQRARPQGPDDVRPDDGRLVDLHRQPGHRAGHVRDVRRGGAPALRRRRSPTSGS